MPYMPSVHDYSGDMDPDGKEIVAAFLSVERKKELHDAIEGVVDDEFDRLAEYAEEHISDLAATRAEGFLGKVLAGDEDAAIELISHSHRSRYHVSFDPAASPDKPWARVIHGTIFETSSMELRRKIVEAHAELIRNAFIEDQASIIKGLQLDIAELNRRLVIANNA